MPHATAARRPAAVTPPAPAKGTAPGAPPPAPAARPGALQALRAHHGAALAPWWWTAQAASAGFTAHALPGLEAQVIAAGIFGAAGAGLGARNVLKRKRSKRVRRAMAAAVAGGAGWTLTAAGIGPLAGHYHPLLIILAAGGAVTGAHWRKVSAAPRTALPAKAAPGPGPAGKAVRPDDPRVTRFRAWFCQPGMLLHKAALDFADIGGGFTVDFILDPDTDHTVHDLNEVFLKRLAKKYDVPLDQVSVEEHPVRRSASRGRVTVLTADMSALEPEWWDGKPTYDPRTGTVVIGRFMDGSPQHWLVHAPGSGAAGGLLAGILGHGKTSTVLVVMTESALARLCRVCGPAGSCRRCRMERFTCTWAGDPTCKPFVELKGRADLVAWGPVACVVMMCWAVAALRARGNAGDEGWTDHLGRFHEDKGSFDPLPGRHPLLQVTVDEWPRIIKHAAGQVATGAASEIISTGRKFGVTENFVTLLPDLPFMGDRDVRELIQAFNVLTHRIDGMSKSMLGVEGNPASLPKGVPGLNYMAGIDGRPAMPGRTKGLRDVRRPGGPEVTDVRELWDRIALEPVDLEPAVMAVLGPLGYTGRGQVLRDEDVTPEMWAAALAAAGFRVPDEYGQAPAVSRAGAAPAPKAAGQAPAEYLAAARKIIGDIAGEGRDADVFDLMERSGAVLGGDGMSALDAERAADALVAAGDAVKTGNLYAPAPAEAGR